VKTGRKSFVDVVKEDSQRRWKGLIIKTKQQVLPWIEYSVIGQFRDELDFEQLGEEYVKGGMSMVRVRVYGGQSCPPYSARRGKHGGVD